MSHYCGIFQAKSLLHNFTMYGPVTTNSLQVIKKRVKSGLVTKGIWFFQPRSKESGQGRFSPLVRRERIENWQWSSPMSRKTVVPTHQTLSCKIAIIKTYWLRDSLALFYLPLHSLALFYLPLPVHWLFWYFFHHAGANGNRNTLLDKADRPVQRNKDKTNWGLQYVHFHRI